MSIEVKDLCFSYDEQPFIINLNIRFERGKITALTGKTGCGKSTLAKIICALINPDGGTVMLDGKDIFAKKYNRKELRQKVGMVFQFPEMQLFEQSVKKDIEFGLKQFKLSGKEKEKRAINAAKKLNIDYDKFKDKSPLALSGGEKRKVAIAGVLACEPDYLILDEPIAGLDPAARREFMQMLCDLKNDGVGIIIISHNADCICEYADEVIVMQNGSIILEGPPNTVYSDTEKIKKSGIGFGAVCDTVLRLNEKGVSIPLDTVKYDELLNRLTERYGG